MIGRISPQDAARLVGHEHGHDILTVRDHIAQGHFPSDDRGRALVKTRSGSLVTILSIDGPPDFPIVGMSDGEVESWSEDGQYLVDRDTSSWDLLPPEGHR